MKNWTLNLLISHFDECIKGVDASTLRKLNGQQYDELLLQKADEIFSEGRYNQFTEWCLEMYQLPQAEEQLYSLQAIAQLTDDERIRLQFYQRFKELCFPLFSLKGIHLAQSPFNLPTDEFSLGNPELTDFLYKSPYRHLSAVILEALRAQITRGEWGVDSVILDDSSWQFHNVKRDYSEPDFGERVQKLTDYMVDLENHIQVAQRLGMTPQALAINDMIDTFICREFNYRQVDVAKEFSEWLNANWDFENTRPSDEACQLLCNTLKDIMRKHQMSDEVSDETWNYIFMELLHVEMTELDEYDEVDEFDD